MKPRTHLIALRTAAGLSQRQLADKVGTVQQRIQRIEAGRVVRADMAGAIARALGVPMATAFPEVGTEPKARPLPAVGGWGHGLVKTYVGRVRARLGTAWQWLTPDVLAALVTAEAMSVVMGQDRDTVSVIQIRKLVSDMLREAGLDDYADV